LLPRLGEVAALGTALSWSFGSIFFTIASQEIGAFTVNRLRLTLALFLIMITHLLFFGRLFPPGTSLNWFWLGLSGFIGFTIGDTFLFQSFVLLRPRSTMLLMSLVPVFGAIIAWLFLKETISGLKILAGLITISGIIWAIWDKRKEDEKGSDYQLGIIFGLGAAFCQAFGLFASKKGLGNNFPALSGNLIRVLTGTITIWLLPFFWRNLRKTLMRLKEKRVGLAILGGAFFGPFLGVGLSLVAIQNTAIGIAATLMALPPVILIPLSHWIFKERITISAILGTLVAMTGVSLIFLL